MPPLLYSKFPYALGFIADFSLCWIGLAGYLSTNTNHTVLTVCLKCGCVLVAQSCPTLCDPMDLQPARLSSVHGILQARISEWVAMSSSRRCFWPRDQAHVSCITGGLFTIWATGKPYDSFFITGGIMYTLHFFGRIFFIIPVFYYLSIRTLK